MLIPLVAGVIAVRPTAAKRRPQVILITIKSELGAAAAGRPLSTVWN